MEIKIVIPEKNKAEFLEGILKQIPIPKDEETGEALYTAEEWIQVWAKSRLIKLYRAGRKGKVVQDAKDKIVYNVTAEVEK